MNFEKIVGGIFFLVLPWYTISIITIEESI